MGEQSSAVGSTERDWSCSAFICVLCVPRHSGHSFVFLHEALIVYKEHAVNLEKYFAEEFVKLHQFLHDKEQKLIQQINSNSSEILKEMEENLECTKTGVTEIHSAVSDTNLEIKTEVEVLDERSDDTDCLATTEESVSGDTSEHGKRKANGVLSAPESFEDVAVTFSAEEMKMLTKQDKELHKEVMLENYDSLVSTGNGSREWRICCSQQPSLGESLLHYPTENTQHSIQTLKGSNKHPVIPVAQLHPGYTCNMNSGCDRSAIVQQIPLVNRRAHKEKKQYKCPECNKCFKQRTPLVQHKRIHSGERPYKCPECGKFFRQSSALTRHKRTHMGARPYECPECNKCFRQRYSLVEHERTHSGNRPYKCPECSKCFKQRSHLIQHKRTHTQERPHKCLECNKCFRQRHSLVDHERTHSGDRPYKCPECNKCFKQGSHLIEHKRIHTQERPYRCPECNTCFRQMSTLVKHEKTHM
ncbi:zinc finger protein 92 homolog isoform X2 [Protopterus annectens]|uniref:zinc finger protein 92 homolog isoform X2 n=1 Tax=Protopterus annectens TaxID=7888 RepID=UPI001CF96405|nr:zinc finger protein 92 homolog isoform X2 [Protopterus annectens]